MGKVDMFVIVWEFRVPREHMPDFERAYGTGGDWAQLFRKSEGFIGTELLHDRNDLTRFLTVDRWRSRDDFEAFRAEFEDAYMAMDVRCERLTESENRVGVFEMDG
jgi:heme-degrading monooxygenase HmoA